MTENEEAMIAAVEEVKRLADEYREETLDQGIEAAPSCGWLADVILAMIEAQENSKEVYEYFDCYKI